MAQSHTLPAPSSRVWRHSRCAPLGPDGRVVAAQHPDARHMR